MHDIYFYITEDDGIFYLNCSEYEDGFELDFGSMEELKKVIESDKFYFNDHYSGDCKFYEVMVNV